VNLTLTEKQLRGRTAIASRDHSCNQPDLTSSYLQEPVSLQLVERLMPQAKKVLDFGLVRNLDDIGLV
jgi:hypothetical protein